MNLRVRSGIGRRRALVCIITFLLLGYCIRSTASFSTASIASCVAHTKIRYESDQYKPKTCKDDRTDFVTTRLAMSTQDSPRRSVSKKEEPLSPEKVASMIEVSFVEGVMQLAQGYVETIKLFIAAVLTGYGMKIPYDDLMKAVQACPTQTANRLLMPEEENLRATWVKLVYLIAHHVQYRQAFVQGAILLPDDENQSEKDNSDENSWSMYCMILPHLQQKHAQGNETGPRFRAQEILSENTDILPSDDDDSYPMQQALLLQNLRVMWITLTVLEEEKLCYGDSQQPPAPPIPNKLSS